MSVRHRICVFVLVAALLVTGTGLKHDRSALGSNAGMVRIALDVDPDSLVPEFQTSFLLSQLDPLMFDQLTTVDDRGQIVPRLARQIPTSANGGISNDGRAITFHLRRNVRWQDGVPFTSRDVAFTQHAIDDPASAIVGERIVERVETPDAYTAIFHLRRFDPAPLLDLEDYILPEHLLRNVADLRKADFNAHPIGTGPFKVVRWVRGDRIELVANDDYFMGRPGLREITIQLMPSADAEHAALVTGAADWMVGSTPRMFDSLRNSPNLRTFQVARYTWYGIALNLAHPPLDDVRVRRALSMAIDRTVVGKPFLGTALPAGGDIPSFSWAYDPSEQAPPYDLQGARALMREAGWIDRGDGRLAKDGRTLELSLTSTPILEELDLQIEQELRLLGVGVDIKTFPLLIYYDLDGPITQGRFDLGVVRSDSNPDPAENDYFACDQFPPKGHNYPHYCNSKMDALLRDSVASSNRGVRKVSYAKIERILTTDMPYIFLLWPKISTLVNVRLHEFRPGPGAFAWNAWQWST
jgi:peptide/nickel transport system substrate-binding protein